MMLKFKRFSGERFYLLRDDDEPIWISAMIPNVAVPITIHVKAPQHIQVLREELLPTVTRHQKGHGV